MFSFVDHCYVQIAPCKMEAMQKTLPEISLIIATTAASRLVQKFMGYLLRPMAFFAPIEEPRLGDAHCRVPEGTG